ncbi:MAG: pyridoxamine 5'-phosphate oxidase family protein [Woeseiaceae bacterium]
MHENQIHEFVDVLQTFDHAMLVTQRGTELRSRPMAIADRTRDGHVWFITDVDSGKLEELTEHPEVNLAMQSDSRFLSISGTVRATRDSDKIDELWSDLQELWFSKGRNDPALILLEIVPMYAEYWDRSGIEAVKFMFAAAKSMATGETLGSDEGKHAKIRFPKSSG